jgi:hypothetical protein
MEWFSDGEARRHVVADRAVLSGHIRAGEAFRGSLSKEKPTCSWHVLVTHTRNHTSSCDSVEPYIEGLHGHARGADWAPSWRVGSWGDANVLTCD